MIFCKNMFVCSVKGSTPSYGTGPGKSLGGMYAYVEASGQQYGSYAMLSSEAASLATTGEFL